MKKLRVNRAYVSSALSKLLATLFIVSFCTALLNSQTLEFTKSFSGPVVAGGTGTVTFTLTNNSPSTITDISFTDDLDATVSGMIATDLPKNDICATGSQVTGTSVITFTGGSLNPGSMCSFDVTFQVPVDVDPDTYTNTTSSLTGVPDGRGTITIDPASDDLEVVAGPLFSKGFFPEIITSGERSYLTFTIDNSLNALAVSDLDFTDNLPAGIVVASPSFLSTTCTGGTILGIDGSGTISYSGGSVAAGATCEVRVYVTGSTPGIYDNVSGALTSSAGNSGSAIASLEVISEDVSNFEMEFSPSSIPNGGISTLTYTFDEFNSDVNGLGFTDKLPDGVLVANDPNVQSTCGGSVLAQPGNDTIFFSGGSVTAMNSCTVSVDVKSSVIATHNNDANLIIGGDGDPIPSNVAELIVYAFLDITLDDSVSYDPSMDQIANPNDSIQYTLTIENLGDTSVFDLGIDDGMDPNTTLDPSTIRATPVAINDQYELMGNPMTISMAIGLLSNDADVNDPLPNPPFNENLTVSSVQGNAPGGSLSTENGGTVTVQSDGSFEYDSTGVNTAIADSFYYKLIDSEGFEDSAKVIISWSRPPMAQNDEFTAVVNQMSTYPTDTLFADNGNGMDDLGVPPGTLVSFGAGDISGSSDVSDFAAGNSTGMGDFAGGTLTVNADGSFTVSNPTMSGNFSFEYRLDNGIGVSDATVTVTIQEVPAAQDDSYTFLFSVDQNIAAGSGLFVDNGSGADDLGFPAATVESFGGGDLMGSVTDNPAGSGASLAGGTLTVNSDGSWSLTGQPFTPGTYTFDYRLSNAAGSSDATVTLVIQDPPAANDDELDAIVGMVNSYSVDTLFDNNGSGVDDLGTPEAVISNFGGGDLGGTVTDYSAGQTTGPGSFAGGTLTVNADGSFSINNPTTSGEFTFLYRLENASGFSDATVTVTIQGPPDGMDDSDATVIAGTSSPGDNNFHININANSSAQINVFLDNGFGADNLGLPSAISEPPSDVINSVQLAGSSDSGTGSIGGGAITIGGSGSIEITSMGDLNFTPPTDFVGIIEFDYTLANSIGTDATPATVTLAVGNRPSAMNDSYSATGNIPINTTNVMGNDLLQNDSGDDISVTLVQGSVMNVGAAVATDQGGSVTVMATGEFEYTPPAGFTGDDTFTYSVDNGFNDPSQATVTITVSDMVYFMDDMADAGGDGTLTNPFQSISEHNSAPPIANSYLFIEDNGNSYTGNLTLVVGQTVIGEGTVGTLFGGSSLTGITLAALSNTIPYSVSGTSTDWAELGNGSGNAVTLNTDNTITGLNIGTRSGFAITDPGAGVGTLSVTESTVTGTGGGVKIENGGAITLTLSALNTNGGTHGLWLVNTTGTVMVSGGTMTSPTTSGIIISGGSTNVNFSAGSMISQGANANTINVLNGHTGMLTYSGTVNSTNGNGLQFNNADGQYNLNGTVTLNGGDAGIDIVNGSGGAFTFSNATITNPTGTAFNVNNSSANITYTAGTITQNSSAAGVVINANTSIANLGCQLTLNTGANQGINISGGGTVNITHAQNTVSTTTSTAVTINNTNIGTSGVTLQSVSANGATRGAYLNNAGPQAGGFFTVTGTGTTDGSGGTIQNIVNRGFEIINTDNVTLKNMNFTNVGTADGAGTCDGLDNSGCNAGIYGSASNDITMDNLSLNEGVQIGINGNDINNWTLSNSMVQNFGGEVNEHGIYMRELTGTVAINNSTIQTSSERNVLIETSSGSLDFESTGSTYAQTSMAFGADGLDFGINGTTTATIDIDNCTFNANRTNGIQLRAEGSATVTQCDITNSNFDPMGGTGIGIDLATNFSASLNFNIIGNPKIYSNGGPAVNIFSAVSSSVEGRINNNPDIQVGGAGTAGIGIRVNINENSRGIVEIDNNSISNIGNDIGIDAVARLKAGTACGTGCTQGRLDATITNNTVTVTGGSLYDIRTQAQESSTVCANVANNSASAAGISAYRARTNHADATLILEGFNTDGTTTWNNNGNTPASSVSGGHAGTLTGGTCTNPSNAMP
ncbi:Ig-like domain-containing protein [Membranihabitans maritimus]|uniref:DUF7933 domain-containing protein n=1 Tax=Membranihabitans maritimus TaxID=2904244 RepID=UPI001F2484EC|nr:Ig-like domain-containing protein [Membranihabitans maritimus]